MSARRGTLTVVFVILAVLVALGLFIDARADLAAARAEARNPPLGQFVDAGGVQIHAVVMGEAGPWVVLIHGASGNVRDWTFSFAEGLARDYRVAIFDRPGLGYSGRAEASLGGAFDTRAESPAVQAGVLAEAAAALGVTDPVVVGHSYGGAVALAWALDHPAAAVVLNAGVALPWPGGLDWTYDVIGNPLGGAVLPPLASAVIGEGYLRENLAGVFAPDPAPEGYLERGGVLLATRAETIRANGRQVARLRPFVVEQSARYGEITLPVEVLHGTADTIVPADVHAIPLSERFDTVELTLIEDMGHMPHHTHPEALRGAIDRAAARAGLHGPSAPLD